MSEQRSPRLEQMFAAAHRELADEAFVTAVMAKTTAHSMGRVAIYIAVCAVAVPATWFVAGPLNDALSWVTVLIAQPVAPAAGEGITGTVTLPMNSVGGVLVLTVFVARVIARRLFSTGS